MTPNKCDKDLKDQSSDSGSRRVNSAPDPSGNRPLQGIEDLSVPGGTEQPKNDRRKRGDIQKRER
jgi:hypothetical protein